mgnify:CR=1 FL=1
MMRQRVPRKTNPKIPFSAKIAKFSKWIVSKESPLRMRWGSTTKVITLFSNESYWDIKYYRNHTSFENFEQNFIEIPPISLTFS